MRSSFWIKTAALDWYCTLLRGHVVYQGHGLAFVTLNDEHHRIAFVQLPEDAEAKSRVHIAAAPLG
jgi:hypothetical protein